MITLRNDGFTAAMVAQHEMDQALAKMEADHERERYLEETVGLPLLAAVLFGMIYAVADLLTEQPFPTFF